MLVWGRGCLGACAAGYGIAEEWRRRVARDGSSVSVDPAGGDLVSANAEEVFQAAAKGDEAAGAIIEEACRALGAALGGVINGLNPEVIVVTGGTKVAGAPPGLRFSTASAVRARSGTGGCPHPPGPGA